MTARDRSKPPRVATRNATRHSPAPLMWSVNTLISASKISTWRHSNVRERATLIAGIVVISVAQRGSLMAAIGLAAVLLAIALAFSYWGRRRQQMAPAPVYRALYRTNGCRVRSPEDWERRQDASLPARGAVTEPRLR